MIAPFIPYGITGFLWYQGESNASRSDEYADLFPRLLRQFRTDFGDHPFYFVQLANFDNVRKDVSGRQWAFLREAQSRLLDQPNTGMAVTIDVGDADDVHPRNKAEVGRRLALQVLRNQHAHKIEADGPRFEFATPENGAMRVNFHDSPQLDLRSPDAPKSFEVAGADGVFQPALATVEGATLLVASEKVPQPRFVRYAWFNNPTAVLFSKKGLPAAPFQSNKQTQ
jgi:sialate O-acetylesterase